MLKSALITGCTGFIGASLAQRLSSEGTAAYCLVREGNTGRAALDQLPGVEVLTADHRSAESLADAVRSVSPDIVFHLAAYGVSPQHCDPHAMIDGNVGLTARVLTAIAGRGVRRVVFAGSCSQYAAANEPELVAEDFPQAPTTLYGAAKLAAEAYARVLAEHLSIPLIRLRLFGVYGPGEAPQRLIPHLLDHFHRGVTPQLTPGEQARDLTYIDDVVEALLAAATHQNVLPDQAYNVCSGIGVRIARVAAIVAEAAGCPDADLGLGLRPYRPDEPMWIVGDPTRFQTAAGWRPTTPLEEGIRRMSLVSQERSRSASGRSR